MSPVLKHVIRRMLHSAAFSAAVRLLEDCSGCRANQLRVLTYHRVDDPRARPDLAPHVLSATPEDFARQMQVLASGYHVVSAREVLDAVIGSCTLPERSVLITFDDGYRDFAEHAWPILRHLGLPVTLFVPTAYPDQPSRAFWWDRLYQAVCRTPGVPEIETPWGRISLADDAVRWKTYRRLCDWVVRSPSSVANEFVDRVSRELGTDPPPHCVLGWDELRRLSHEGVTLGCHTHTHPLMNRVSLDQARAEAVSSRQHLQRNVGETLPIFAYPGGGFTPESSRMLEREGFVLAFATCRGVNDLDRGDSRCLRRINVGKSTNEAVLRAQLTLPGRLFNRLYPLQSAS
jgi:peptidoglycan/xylan/chitin deacetylase (PgdA/CDA1 family)